MKRNNLGYYIKEGVSNIFAHGFMSFASIFIIIACLIIMGSFALLALNVNSMIKTFENQNVVLAFVDDSFTPAQAQGLQSQILSVSNVASATYISKDQAMQSFESRYQDQSIFAGLDSSVLRDRYEIFMKDVALTAQTQTDLSKIPGIVKVNANLDVAKGFVTVRNVVSVVSVIIVVVLLVISLFIMSNTIKLATLERREEIAIMKMVGATNGFIRWPFVFEGFILGMVGTLAAFVAQWGIYSVVAKRLLGSYNISFITLIPFSNVAIPMFVVFVLIGFGVGVGGSVMAIRNYLRV